MHEPTDPMWNVFISHSTNGTNGVAKCLLEKLMQALGSTYDVRVDQAGIRLGADWQEWIHGALHDSHLAIILLDAKAATKKWVKREATLLRYLLKFSNRMIPVLIGITSDEARDLEDFEYLLDRQAVYALDFDDSAKVEAEAERVRKLIMERLGECSSGLYKEDVLLSRTLSKTFKLDDDEEAEGFIDRHFHGQAGKTAHHPFFQAEWLAKFVLDARLAERAVKAIKDVAFDYNRIHQARPILLSSWITWPEARPIRIDNPATPGPRAPVLFTGDSSVAEQYVSRAYGCAPSITDVGRVDHEANGEPRTVATVVDRLFASGGYLNCRIGSDGTCRKHSDYPKKVLVEVVGGLDFATDIVKEIHRRCPLTVVILIIPPEEYGHLSERTIKDMVGDAYRPMKPVDEERSGRFYNARGEIETILSQRGGHR